MARCVTSHSCGLLVALGWEEKWHCPGWAGAALCFVGCLLQMGPVGGGAQDGHFAPGFVAPGLL